jgi:hypothetical protein
MKTEAKRFYMEGAETTLNLIVKENLEMITDKEIEELQKLKVNEMVFIGLTGIIRTL